MRYVAPAGTPLTLTEIGRGLARGWASEDAELRLADRLCALSGSVRAWPLVSGRAAMTLALRALAAVSEPRRRRVIVPAYTCYSVPAAIERAGLDPVPCDLDPATLSFDLDHLQQLRSADVLAVISANLFGIPNQLAEIERITRQWGTYFLDDAAQALGATLNGRPVGGFGDLGLFSFDKGKNITTMQGGALVARDGPLVTALDREYRPLPAAGFAQTASTIAKLVPYSLFLRPARYGLIRSLPLGLGETPYETRYPETRMSRSLAGLASDQLARIGDLRSRRVANASALRAVLEGVPGVRFFDVPPGAVAAFPRFPVRLSSRATRDVLQQTLDRDGIGASCFYPSALVDVPQVARRMPATTHQFSGAREVAQTILTLPTHAHSPPDLAARVRLAALAVN